jgi:hypothetical protein
MPEDLRRCRLRITNIGGKPDPINFILKFQAIIRAENIAPIS